MNQVDSDNARNQMWIDILGGEYFYADKHRKKKMRHKYAEQMGTTPGGINLDYDTGVITYPMTSLDCCKPAIPVCPIGYEDQFGIRELRKKQKQEQKEQAMNAYASAAMINQQVDPDAGKIAHMIDRLHTIYRNKEKEAMDTFGYNDDKYPKSPKELVERIKAGEFTFEDTRVLTQDGDWSDADDKWGHQSAIEYIVWRTKPIDREGYKAWTVKAKALKQEVEDTIRVLTPAEGLQALQRFEGTTIN